MISPAHIPNFNKPLFPIFVNAFIFAIELYVPLSACISVIKLNEIAPVLFNEFTFALVCATSFSIYVGNKLA